MFIPEFLKKVGNASPGNKAWVNALPSIVNQLKREWNLKTGSPYTEGATCSYVVPCIVGKYEKAVLKIGLPHEEGRDEIEGLKLLNGNPTVKLLRFNKQLNAMLLEQCVSGTSLKVMPEPFQDEIICDLLTELWQVDYSPENFRPLGLMVSQWNKETYENLDSFPDPDLAKEGCKLKEKLIKSTEILTFLATDLHAGNVLQAQRSDWLSIDIKPYIGDPAYDLTQHLLNCTQRLRENPKGLIQRVAKLAGVDPSRLKDWMFARLATENGGVYQKIAFDLR